jgi:hypothetical protein
MRISVSGWQTTAADADRSADAILAALHAVTGTARRPPPAADGAVVLTAPSTADGRGPATAS